MSETNRKTSTTSGKAAKGSKAACEAAGWRFTPLPGIARPGSGLPRRYGNRGTMVIPPAGSGIEPRQFDGSGRAIAWAVEQLGHVAQRPHEAPAGMAGIRTLLTAALASGEICGGRDDTPERPDAELLAICKDAFAAAGCIDSPLLEPTYEGKVLYGKTPEYAAWRASLKERERALRKLPALHATTREGLLQKARAARLILQCGSSIPGSVREELVDSLILDLIHLVPTLIDAQAGSTVAPGGDPEAVS